jgi:hypothetical protein
MVRHVTILALPLLALLFAATPEVGSQEAGSQGGVLVSYEDCRRMTRYVPADDADYRPGVDVYGRPVASADLDGGAGAVELPRTVTFYLEFAPFETEEDGEPALGGKEQLDQSTIVLGRVTVDEDGYTYFEGQPLHDEEEARLYRLCREALAARPE